MSSTVRRFVARPTSAGGCTLGEGPLWDPATAGVMWVDISAGQVHLGDLSVGRSLDSHCSKAPVDVVPRASWSFPETVGAAVPGPKGTLLVAARHELRHVSAEGKTITAWPVLAPDVESRLNDGACDPAGRFLVGSLAQDDRTGTELLVRLEPTGQITVIDRDLTLSNGLAWSPDGSVFYSVDSVPGRVFRRSYDVDTGAVGPRETLLQDLDGIPDGLTVDSNGNLWIALWGASEVRCHRPDGELVGVVDVDAPHTTSVAFVGPEHDLLMITTARADLSEAQLRQHPDSGRVFLADVGVQGLPSTPWRPPAAT